MPRSSDEDADQPVVLIAEDEPDVTATYEMWLTDEYEVRRPKTGQRHSPGSTTRLTWYFSTG